MSALTETRPKAAGAARWSAVRGLAESAEPALGGCGAAGAVNLYLLAQMGFLWQAASSNNADAMAQQRIALKTAEIAAQPLRGLDAKLARATEEADSFYASGCRRPTPRLRGLGALTKGHMCG